MADGSQKCGVSLQRLTFVYEPLSFSGEIGHLRCAAQISNQKDTKDVNQSQTLFNHCSSLPVKVGY
jgi:hypothetical protein